jgi:NitT/TauT family transport system substrate-binding protein
MLASCKPEQPNNNENDNSTVDKNLQVNVTVLSGTTGFGMAPLMQSHADGKAALNYNFKVEADASNVNAALINGTVDIAALPTNAASVVYNKTGGAVQLLAINTLGVLNIVTKGVEINSFEDLKGKTIYATGKGTTPEYAIRYLLTQNGINPDEDVTFEWKNEAAEIGTRFSTDAEIIALLPQPYVTSVLVQNADAKIALDLSNEWDALENGTSLVTGVLVVRKDFAEKNPK